MAQLVDRALEALEGVAQDVLVPRMFEEQAKSVAQQREGVANFVAKQHAIVANSVAEQRERVAQDVLVPRMSEGQANLVANQRGSVAKSVATQRLISQAEELREQGLSWVEITRRWNAEGIPTLTGKGQWHDANIARLVKSAAR